MILVKEKEMGNSLCDVNNCDEVGVKDITLPLIKDFPIHLCQKHSEKFLSETVPNMTEIVNLFLIGKRD